MNKVGDDLEEGDIEPKNLILEEEVRKTLMSDKGEDAELISWDIVNFTKPGDNYSSFITSIEVRYSLDDDASDAVYVVKVNACRKLEGFQAITHILFEKEANFYLTIVPELNTVLEEAGMDALHLPKCYNAYLESGQEQIFYEDLRDKGFQMVNRVLGLDVPHATLALQEIAKLHAASKLLQEKHPDETLGEKYESILRCWLNLDEEASDCLIPMIKGNLSHAIDILEKSGGHQRAIVWIHSLQDNLQEIVKREMESNTFGSICHGDYWSNNLLFSYNDDGEPTKVMMVDLEACRYATLAADLNYLMYTSMTEETRQDHLGDFLNAYYSSFKEIIEKGGMAMDFTEEELLEEYRKKNILGAIFAIMIIPTVLLESGDIPDLSAVGGNLEEELDDFWSQIKESVGNSPMLKPRFLSMFEEFMENGLIP